MQELKIGDTIQRFRCQGEILEHEYIIDSESKSEVKSGSIRFRKKIQENGHVTRVGNYNRLWYIIKK